MHSNWRSRNSSERVSVESEVVTTEVVAGCVSSFWLLLSLALSEMMEDEEDDRLLLTVVLVSSCSCSNKDVFASCCVTLEMEEDLVDVAEVAEVADVGSVCFIMVAYSSLMR